jgi:hypothetical protein
MKKKSNTMENIIAYKKAKSQAKRTQTTESQNFWQNYCNSLTSSTKLSSVWRMSKRMNGISASPSSQVLTIDNETSINNQDKSNKFAQTFTQVSSNMKTILLPSRSIEPNLNLKMPNSPKKIL